MKEPKSAGPEVGIEPDRAKCATERPGCESSQDGKGGPDQGRQELWEAQWQEFLKSLQPLPPETPESAPWEDAKAFLASFEQVAQACRWPRGEWAARLLPALSGEAGEAFRSLEAGDREDYGKVKAAILRGEALRTEAERQHFRRFCCQQGEEPRRIQLQLQELCHRWLQPDRRSKEQIVELLVLEQFLASLPPELQSWIRAGGPESCSQAVALAEEFLGASQQDSAENPQWQGQLKEDPIDSLDALQVEIYEEAKESGGREIEYSQGSYSGQFCGEILNQPGNTTQGSSPSHRLLSPEGHGMEQAGEREGPMALKETVVPLQIVRQGVTQAEPQTLVWKVLKKQEEEEEEEGRRDSLGDGKGSEVKVENLEYGGRELTEGPAAAVCQASPVGRTGQTALFSRYGRRYLDQSERAAVQTAEEENEHHVSREDVQGQQRSKRGERKGEFSENWERSILTRHLGAAMQAKPPNSPDCQQSFISAKAIEGSKPKPCKCSDCGKCFSRIDHLKEHQLLHTGDKPHKCSDCGKAFTQKSHLWRHQEIHTGEKSYKCSQCGKAFARKAHLQSHQKVHTGEKSYKCSQCGRAFAHNSNLKRHQKVHTGEKSYNCSQCRKVFSRQDYLQFHHKIHTGEKS